MPPFPFWRRYECASGEWGRAVSTPGFYCLNLFAQGYVFADFELDLQVCDGGPELVELLGEEMDGFFELRTGFVCKERSGWRLLVDPSLSYTLVLQQDWFKTFFPTEGDAMKEIENLLFRIRRFFCATCAWRIWVKSVSGCVFACACVRVCISVCVGCRNTQCISFFFFLLWHTMVQLF